MSIRNIADLFEERPPHWGLRGDPYLWAEMKLHFSSTPLPASVSELETLLVEAFAALTGLPITSKDFIVADRYRSPHGGMSSGAVDPGFWRDLAVPLLIARFAAASEPDPSGHAPR